MASVCIIMGSKSDEEKVAPCAEILKKLGIDGAIAGKAVYTGTLDLAKAIEQAK